MTAEVEPILIKAGDERVLLGVFRKPPKVDCRVVSEKKYQELLYASTKAEEVAIEFMEWYDNYPGNVTAKQLFDEWYTQKKQDNNTC